MNFKFGRTYISEVVTDFSSVVFPLVRRVFPQLVGQEIVAVQPMILPVGRLYYLDIDYGTSKKEFILKTFKFGR
jgi:hypothetical protein